MSFRLRSLTACLSLALLAACGGGGGETPASKAGAAPGKPAEGKANKPAAQAPAKAAGNAAEAAKQEGAAKGAGAANKAEVEAEVIAAVESAKQTLAETKMPSQDEADAAAAAQINAGNADAEYEKLLKELEGGG
jgi:hypothetical protein